MSEFFEGAAPKTVRSGTLDGEQCYGVTSCCVATIE